MSGLHTVRSAILAFVALTAVGCSCVKKEELDTVRAEASQARSTADQALATAREANQLSADGLAHAQKAEEAVNRGFKKSMRK